MMSISWNEFMDRHADKFRGSMESIKQVQERRYKGKVQAIYDSLKKPVLDIGSGRGEWLTILHEAHIPAIGIELNPLQAQRLIEQGLTVHCEDAIKYLRNRPADSLSVVTAFQVVEHWSAPLVWEAINLAYNALSTGGLLILETVNVSSVWAWNHFAYDPTHTLPLPPDLLKFMVEQAGFEPVTVEFFAPVPEHMQLPVNSPQVHALNQWLYGPQDYAVFGMK
ncbi:class I SAM-dependent methyltransferase [Sulfobacillus thermosulfidooxidans]|uniref:class I SAM-dependent methyltransferase n=1 Tax=Sulfobacillus thermosulfidooxidans TaxID=28034 RepID=UPI00030B5666|nr:class I SAM-dependent methyltransferase [Sulfobacillus thermosulfidooxidans]